MNIIISYKVTYSSCGQRRPPSNISITRFFDRPDSEKQFLYQLLLAEKNPDAAIANFRECLSRVNSQDRFDSFMQSGFHVVVRDENRSVEDTMKIVEKNLKL